VWRWHVLLKAPEGAPMADTLRAALGALPRRNDVAVAVDVDPIDLL
jgi:primosomal protein N'